MSVILPISNAIGQGAQRAATNAARSIVSANSAQIATGQAASLASAGLWGTVAYLGQALKAGAVKIASIGGATAAGGTANAAAFGADAGATYAANVALPFLSKTAFSIPYFGTAVAAGDLVTGGAAGLAAMSLSNLAKISTGKGFIGHAASAGSYVGSAFSNVFGAAKGLFSKGAQTVSQQASRLVA